MKQLKNHTRPMRIGEIDNNMGYLLVTKEGGKFYWGMKNENQHASYDIFWEEIPVALYDQLVAFEQARKDGERQ